METTKKIDCVTGASGRIGFALCIELKKRGRKVRALCRKDNHITALLREIVDEIAFGDVTNPASLDEAFANIDIVYHLAGVISIESTPPPILEKANVDGTQNVINSCLKNNVRRLIYVSSVHAVHFDNNNDLLVEPKRFEPDKVHGAYAKSKALASNKVLDATKSNGLDAVIAMPSGVIGPYEYALSNFGQMIAAVAEKKLKFYIKGEYDFVDARDVSAALAELSEKGVTGESYFIGGHKAKVKTLMDIVASSTGVKAPRICVPTFLVKMSAPIAEKRSIKKGIKPTFTPYSIKVLHDNCNFSQEKLKAAIGYAPRSLAESLKDQANFYFESIKKGN